VKTFAVHHVTYIPKELSQGILYLSKEYAVAGHLCACGCGSKVITPLGPAEWTYSERNEHPTLYPSIGNWQMPCRSHYFITEGQVQWAARWSDAQIASGRSAEEQRREAYYKSMDRKRGFWHRLWNMVRKLFAR
jgi:Family of unknown function (DUF6527)